MPGTRGGLAAEPGSAERRQTKAERRPQRRALLALVGDERLATRAQQGDEAALEAIFRRYEQDLYRFCMGILGEPQDAQDALQNTMVKVLRALPGERREIKLKPWLYRVAHNEAVELRRRQRPVDPLEPEIAAAGASLEDQAEGDERLRNLFEDMSELPQRQRAALVMRELNGLDFGEIGAALGTSPGAVRQALYEARRGLNEMKQGRDMRCEEASLVLSDQDGSTRGRRDVRAHLRTCADCRRFRAEIGDRKQTLAAISPLPAFIAVGIAKGVLGGAGAAGAGVAGGGTAGAGAAGGALGGGVGAAGGGALGAGAAGGGAVAASIGASGVAKSVAGILAVVVIGTAAADRGGLVHLGAGQPRHAADHPSGSRNAGQGAAPDGRVQLEAQRRPGPPARGARSQVHRSAASPQDPRGSRAQAGETVTAGGATRSAAAAPPVLAGSAPKAKPIEAGGGASAEDGADAEGERPAKEHPEHPAHAEKPDQGEKPQAAEPGKPEKAEAEKPGEGHAEQPETAGAETPAESEGEKAAKEHPEHPEHPERGPKGEASPAAEAAPPSAPTSAPAPAAETAPASEPATTGASGHPEHPEHPAHPEHPTHAQKSTGAAEPAAAPFDASPAAEAPPQAEAAVG